MESGTKSNPNRPQTSDCTKKLFAAQCWRALLIVTCGILGIVHCSGLDAPGYLAPGDGSPPGLIVASSVGRYVTFNWSLVAGAASYQLNVRDVTTDPNGPVSNYILNSATTISIVLSNHHAYKWNVYACSGANATGTKTLSTNAWFRFLNPPFLEFPGNTTSGSPVQTVLSLTPSIQWDSVTEADGYWFYLSEYPYGPNHIIYDTGFGTAITSFNLPNGYLVPGKSYAWNMTSLWGSEESPTLGRALYFTVDNVPDAPTGLTASGGASSIVLTWNHTSASAYGQKIERQIGANGAWNQIADVNWNDVSYTDSNVIPGRDFYYRVYGYNEMGNSTASYSGAASLSYPVNISVTDPNNGQALQSGSSYTVSFSASGATANISYYDFAYSTDAGASYSAVASGISSGAIGYFWTVDNCVSSTQGRVRVRAFNSSDSVIGVGVNPSNFTITSPSAGFLTANVEVTTPSPSPGQAIIFSALKSRPANSCSPIVLYTWTFPDKTVSGANASIVLRTFNVPAQGANSFNVGLTVQDSAGSTSTTYIPITVSGWGQGVSSSASFSHDPVNLANGNYVYQHTDLHIPGIGFPFEFKRFYNSQFSDQTGTPLGFGWTHNYNTLLSTTTTNATVTYGDGHTEIYYAVSGQYQGAPGVFNLLVTNADDTFSVITKEQTKQNFNLQGRLISIVDKNANKLTLAYSNNVLTNITDTAGRQIVFQNDGLGRITQITDPLGRSIQFQYDVASNLVAAIDANLGTNGFLYDTNHQITAGYDARGHCFVTNTYDALQRIVTYQADAYTNQSGFYYDFSNHVAYVTNALGKYSVHRHDSNLLVTNIQDEAGNQEFFLYDTNRNRTFVQDKNGNQTQYGYDSRGNVTNKIDALTHATSIQYDLLNDPIRRIDALNNVTTFGYDANGNLTSTTNALNYVNVVQYHPNGLPHIVTDARGNSTTNYFDDQGNLIASVNSDGFTNRFGYDPVGRKIRQIDPLNRTNSFVYDNNDNLLFITNALGFVSAFAYDANNNRISSTSSRNATSTNIFDFKDRPVASLAPLSFTNGIMYDPLDRKIVAFDALGNPTAYAYDDVGDLLAVTNALTQTTRFTFDPNGNQTSVIYPTGHYVTNSYDALNRRFSTIDVGISTNLTGYDALGRVIATTNANGQITRLSYDALGHLTNVVDAVGKSASFAYDENGNRIRISDPNGNNWTNIFDKLNRLVEQDDPQAHKTFLNLDAVGNVTNKITPNAASIFYAYDGLHRLTNITYPSGSPVTFAYDEVGNRTNMIDGLGVTTWQYDLLNRLVSVIDPYGQTISNTFDANGNRVALVYPGSKVVNYGFDALNRMTSFTNWLSGIVSYAYDERGNLISATNANGTTSVYNYDAANRMVALTNSEPNASVIAAYALTLDGIGNHQQETHDQPLFPILSNQTNAYSYDADNRLLAVDGQAVAHNNNGDLTAIGTNITYTYNFEDRLIQFTATNVSGTCSYDGLGNRLARTLNGQPRRFVLDRLGTLTQMLVETDTNNFPVAYYVYGLGLAQRISGGTVATYHFNIQGSTVALTDSGGNVTDSYAYDSFGILGNVDGDSAQPFRYLGRYGIIDDSIGLLYVRARYYSPQLGRFVTKDTAAGRDSDSQSLNRYIYSEANPVALFDPTGFSAIYQNQFLLSLLLPTDLKSHILLLGGELQIRVANSTPSLLSAGTSGVNSEPTIYLISAINSIRTDIGNPIGKTGQIGEEYLNTLGGESQVFFKTTQGARYIDQLVNGIANEAKVGYQSLTSTISRQIMKDVELMESGQIQGSTWNFFRSPKTGKIGPSQPLRQALEDNGIKINEFDDIEFMF